MSEFASLDFATAIPDPQALFDWVQERDTNKDSELHGHHHWRHVARVGYWLLRETPDADAVATYLFAMFHDSQRENDFTDPHHGERGATLLVEAAQTDLIKLDEDRLGLAVFACSTHTNGFQGEMTTKEPTIGVCWDADRLNLWRVGIWPSSLYLSTDAARHSELIESCSAQVRSEPPTFHELAMLYNVLEELRASEAS
jgi:uncharacterized protein